MTPDEYAVLTAPIPKVTPTINIKDLENKSPRTLLWGYTSCRESHHVYIADGRIHLHVYLGSDDPNVAPAGNYRSGILPLKDVVPDKRLYPEACDAEFCRILKDWGVYLPFTTWHIRESKQYYGKLVTNQQLCNEGKTHDESSCSQYH